MKNEFVPYDIALAMKELGFDEACFGWYSGAGMHTLAIETSKNSEGWLLGKNCSAPLYQQAFRWFRDELKDSAFEPYDMVKHYSYNMKVSWEKAQDACLRKLIEIVKEKRDEDN